MNAERKTYTVNFSVTVDIQASYGARFLTQNLYPQAFDVSFVPANIAGSGSMTFNATATIRTPHQATLDRSGFVIALEGLSRAPVPGGPPFDETYLGVLAPCIVAAGQPGTPGMLPDTGASGVLSLSYPIVYIVVAALLLTTGAHLRRRLMQHG